MPLESSVTNIADLNPAWPAPADPKSDGDDHIRNLKKALLNDFTGYTGAVCATGVDGGSANAYTVTPANALPAYGLRMAVVFSPTLANTGACTLNVSGLGAKPLRAVDGSELGLGDLVAGQVYGVLYTGAEFRLPGPTKNYIDQKSFLASLPAQFGNAGKYITSDGVNASWSYPILRRSMRAANAVLVASDACSFVDIASGTFSQTLAAAATLGAGWYCYVRNSGTGSITLAPAGADQIDGTTGYVMYPNECRLIQCDGATFTTIVLQAFKLSSQLSGTFQKPPGYNYYDVLLAGAASGGSGGGGGGSGSGIAANNAGGGGGGGGPSGLNGVVSAARFSASRLPATVSFAIGASGVGGNGGTAGAGAASGVNGSSGGTGTAGQAGGASSFGTVNTSYYMSSAGGIAPTGVGGSGTFGFNSQNNGGTASAATSSPVTAFAANATGVSSFPVVNGNGGSAAANSGTPSTTATAGGNGGLGAPAPASYLQPSQIAGAAGLGATASGAVGGSATALSKAPAGQGGAGGSGGGGSTSCGSTANASTVAGGAGAKGQDGGDGLIEITGVI